CAQRWGLVSSVTRLVHFGPLPDELSRRYDALLEVEHSIVRATVPGNALSEIFEIGRRAYRAAGFEGEEQKHFQGGTCGYFGREQELAPSVSYRIREGEVFAHNPSIAGVKLEDTLLTSDNGAFEILTEVPGWPVRELSIEGVSLRRPEILIR
ncbi:MAG TPA: M24 family metallopeptidase, partial [Spirochaetia bacterium]|nr:M24 family metallopeptidase [Spirochaetia bacterium]